MECNETRPLLDASVDRELPTPDARRVQQHIDDCGACRSESDGLRALSQSIRAAASYYRAPDSLIARIAASLPPTESAPQTPRKRRVGWLDNLRWFAPQGTGTGEAPGAAWPGGLIAHGWLTALVIASCAGGAVLALNLHHPADAGPFADELVESHVRAQLSGHNIDVISTDRHTVKPWFNGRLDYAPPVEDLASSGFALEGGRMDYVAHQRVAVLVYRYQKHVLDVYVFPDAASPGLPRNHEGLPPTLMREGYALSHWHTAGMTWWAISDAAPEALGGLETALKTRLQVADKE